MSLLSGLSHPLLGTQLLNLPLGRRYARRFFRHGGLRYGWAERLGFHSKSIVLRPQTFIQHTVSVKSADVKVCPHQLMSPLIVFEASNWSVSYKGCHFYYSFLFILS